MTSDKGLLAPDVSHALAAALIAASGIYVYRWVFDPGMTFFMDDWGWIKLGVFGSWRNFLTLGTFIPAALFGDRPIEGASIKLMYQLFGLDHKPYAAVMLFLHVANALLLYALTARLLQSRFHAMIAGLLFVINHSTGLPGWWVSLIADSASFFFCLCAFLSFASGRAWSAIATIVFYYLAYKSKEVALPFPLLLFAYSFLVHARSAKLSDLRAALAAALRATWPILSAFIVVFGFSMYYFAMANKLDGMAAYGPYAPHFDAATFINGVRWYLSQVVFKFLDGNQALLAFVILLALAVVTGNRVAMVGAAGFFIGTGPVLFLANQRYPYYAYAASGYIALMLAALLQRGDTWLAQKLGNASRLAARAAVVTAALWFTFFVYRMSTERDFLLYSMRDSGQALKTLSTVVPQIDEKSAVVITGLPQGVNLFTHAPCNVIRVLFKVWEIDCRITGTDSDLSAAYERLADPKILLQYSHGNVSLRARSP